MAGLVKHYQNTMKGIPQLTNNWGSMITLLDAVLVNGFNHVPILNLSKANATSITAIINLGSDHGFIARQVIRIAGSTNGWDGDYKVLSVSSDAIIVECTAEHSTIISGTATCFTAPLDFEIVFQTPADSTTPKRAYRSKDPESLGLILLVHDFCVSGASATGAKFAKAGVVSDMSDIDSIVGQQMPFLESTPNRNWGWDGTYHGWAKWYYKLPVYSSPSHSAPDTQAPDNTAAPFFIVGNSTSFLIDCLCSNLNSYTVYGFAEFDDVILGVKNAMLLAAGINAIRAQNDGYYYNSRGSYLKVLEGTTYATKPVDGVVWYDIDGTTNHSYLSENLMVTAPSIDTNVLMDALVFDSANNPRGVIPFLKNHLSQNNETVYLQGVGKTIKRYVSYRSTISQYALTLEHE